MILDAEQRGLLRADSMILECTSGNTGIALAMVGAAAGYPVTILMSDTASAGAAAAYRKVRRQARAIQERQWLCRPESGWRRKWPGRRAHFLPRQFENPLNAADHEHTTGQEILQALPGPIDAFVAGYGTGGTLAGVGKAIKQRYPGAKSSPWNLRRRLCCPARCPAAMRSKG